MAQEVFADNSHPAGSQVVGDIAQEFSLAIIFDMVDRRTQQNRISFGSPGEFVGHSVGTDQLDGGRPKRPALPELKELLKFAVGNGDVAIHPVLDRARHDPQDVGEEGAFIQSLVGGAASMHLYSMRESIFQLIIESLKLKDSPQSISDGMPD